MKKVAISILAILIMMLVPLSCVWATNEVENNDNESNITSQIMEQKEEVESKIDKYVDKYGSKTYGTVAYILNMVRIYSIPFCFVGIAIGGIYQYAIGTRRLDMKQKGFALILSFVSILVICQVLPLIFMICVIGWRG